PDAVVTDIVLRGPEGLDLITRIRSDLRPPVPPIIACSGFPAFREEALRRGAAVFLSKPFDAEDLLRAVEGAIEGGSVPLQVVGAEERSAALRRSALAAAERVLRSLGVSREFVQERAHQLVRWIPRYLGLEEAVFLLFCGGQLRVQVSSREGRTDLEPRWR